MTIVPDPTPVDRVLRVIIVVAVVLALGALVAGGIWALNGRRSAVVIFKPRPTQTVAAENRVAAGDHAVPDEAVEAAVVATNRTEGLRNAEADRIDALTARQRRGCIILRQQGQDLGRYPQCRVAAQRP